MTLPMTTAMQLLREAADAARLAPSVHNTQPWRFVLRPDGLEFHADRDRQLRVADPTGRELMLSCGCAVFNARAALAARGYDAVVTRFPDPGQPDLLARIEVPVQRSDWLPIAALEPQIARRHSNRRRFLETVVAPQALYELAQAAEQEQAELVRVREEAHQLSVARLSQQADALENSDPAYRQELTAWTTDNPQREDGVPAMAVAYRGGDVHDDLPIRDFDTRRMGWLESESRSDASECILVLATAGDDPLSWLHAGEALQRLWLEATRADYVLSLFSQVMEIAQTRAQLRTDLGLKSYPQIVIRVGRAGLTPASRRRELDDVLTVHD